MAQYDYDVVVIGGGAAGLTASKITHGLFKRVLLVEKNKLGGECTWTGCVPSKTIIKSAQIAYHAIHARRWGIQINNQGLDTSSVMTHVRKTVHTVYQSHTPEKMLEIGIAVQFGSPVFQDAHHIQIADQTISFGSCIIATGSHPFVPSIEGLETVDYLTNADLFDLEQLPQSIIILGAGPIGCEMASALNRLGVSVTVIERNDRILSADDAELAQTLQALLEKEGVTFVLRSTAIRVKKTNTADQTTMVCVDEDNIKSKIVAEKVLIAVGRRPNCNGLALEKAGIEYTTRGITVNKYMQTSVPHIYACGDVVGPYLFSHMAWKQAAIAARNACIPWFKSSISYDDVCWVTFTGPELATAGLNEQQAREQFSDAITVYCEPYSSLDRAHTDGETEGMLKCICTKNGTIVGVSLLGERAGEVMHELQLAKTIGTPLYKLQPVIHAYPTYSELAWNVSKRAYVQRLENNPLIRLAKKFIRR